jgi:DNA (cytosine-5)-methyltransferase 1
MNELHLFAGAGGGILGGELLGHTTVCAVEIEEYPRKVLLQRQRDGILPRFPIWDDICTFDGKPWRGRVDVVAGGFPCQDISAAGKGAGIAGSRSGLWSEMARVVSEVRPRFVFVENAKLLVRRGLPSVLGDLAEMGYDASWGVIGACAAGAPHYRYRCWVLAYSEEERRARGRRGGSCEFKQGEFARLVRERYWTEKPIRKAAGFLGMADDVAYRMDRIAAIGNGQVPAVAALAWRLLGGPVA